MQERWKFLFAVGAVLTIFPCLSLAQHYGFGVIKKTVTLERRLLPDVRLRNVSVAVVFPRGTGGLDGNLFSSDLETVIAQSGGGLRLVSREPEFEIQCYTTAYQPVHIVTKTENSPKFLGKAGAPSTQRDAHGNISLDARLIRAADGAVAVAFTESASLNASNFGSSSGTTFVMPTIHIPGLSRNQASAAASTTDPLADTDTDASLSGRLLKTLALRVASHLVLMDERIPVLLAQGGTLDEAARLASNGRWSEYLEQLSSLPAPPAAADNAYLLYDLGVANEALGYASSDPKATLKYLQESSIDYTRATEAKPAEKYFMEPQRRIETAITRYSKLAEARAPQQRPPEQAQRAAVAGEKLTNSDIVKLVKAHIDKGLIVDKIQTAAAADFDLSVDGMVTLSQNGVPSDLIAAMTNRMQHPGAVRAH